MASKARPTTSLSRDALCELLWDLPSDPRAELRCCLSKLRGLLDGPDRRRVLTEGDAIRLDLADVSVDVLELDRAAHAGLASLDAAALRALAARFAGLKMCKAKCAVSMHNYENGSKTLQLTVAP